MSDQKVEFVLFLQPEEGVFYSYSAARGLIVREDEKDVPKRVMNMARQQVEEFRVCLEGAQRHELTPYQRRPVPLNLLTERKFKYPVYYTEESLPASSLENFRFDDNSSSRESLNDYISAVIDVTELKPQLQRSKKGKPSDFLTIDIKLITSVNEVIRTINRVILQDYGIVITMKNEKNKLIFKIKDIEEYLYGNESIANFQYIRQCLTQRKAIHLELMQVSIYDKEQFLKFVFHRGKEDVVRGVYAGFPWEAFLKNHSGETEFLMWHVPEEEYMHPVTTLDMQKLYSPDELVRTTYKIKLKMEEKKRLKTKKMPRFLWKYKMAAFLQKRREELKNRFVETETSVIYSGQCLSVLSLDVVSMKGLFGLFRKAERESKGLRKKVLRFDAREVVGGDQGRLPSLGVRAWQLSQLRRKGQLDMIPSVMNVCLQFVLGTRLLHIHQTSMVTVDNYSVLKQKVSWESISKIPMQTTLVLKVQMFSREGEGGCYGVGAVKLFDSCGFLRQGKVQVQLHAVEKMEYLKVGCFDHLIDAGQQAPTITLEFPTFMANVIWSLSDVTCGKYLGFMPPLKEESQAVRNDQLQPDRVNQLLRYDPLAIHKYSAEDKQLLRRNWKYYRHQTDKLINFLLSIEWDQPDQVAQVYTALQEWTPIKPIEALFLLIPSLPDQRVRYYAVRRMENFLDYEWVLYANQITQSLISFETDLNPLIDLILQKCTFEPYSIGQEYFWQFRNRLEEQFTARRFGQYLESLLMISSFRKEWAKQMRTNSYFVRMNGKLVAETENMDDFNDKNRHFLGTLGEVEDSLKQISSRGFSFPIRPQYIFSRLKADECTMYDSKKLPFTLACSAVNSLSPNQQLPPPYKVMFKYGDDIKQDHLVLQMLRVFDKLWKENNLDCKMNIYRTLSTGHEIGFIEIVEGENNSKIHKVYGKGMVEAFDEKSMAMFLEANNKTKEKMTMARENFIRSSVGYLVGTFVLGVGDRHSGNIMLQPNGKYFHIDFGHFLGNFKKKLGIKRERTPFVFTSESVYVMGGEDSPHFKRFMEDCSKAYIILRKNAGLIVNILAMMVGADIPQLKKMDDVSYMVEKLSLELSDQQAGDQLKAIIRDTLDKERARKLDNAFHEANRVG